MGKMVSGEQQNWVTDASGQVRERYGRGGVWCGHRKTKVTSSGGKRCLFSFGRMWFCLLDWMRVEITNTVYSRI